MQTDPELRFIFSNVNEWLKFAEAKLAGMIVLNSAIIIGILSSYGTIHDYIDKNAAIIGVIAVGASLFWCIATQLPVLNKFLSGGRSTGTLNLYYFGHLANLTQQEFLNEFKRVNPNFSPSLLDEQLTNQILINACIAKAKFVAFRNAGYLTASGIGIIAFTSVIKTLWHL